MPISLTPGRFISQGDYSEVDWFLTDEEPYSLYFGHRNHGLFLLDIPRYLLAEGDFAEQEMQNEIPYGDPPTPVFSLGPGVMHGTVHFGTGVFYNYFPYSAASFAEQDIELEIPPGSPPTAVPSFGAGVQHGGVRFYVGTFYGPY